MTTTVKIITPSGMFGRSGEEDYVTLSMRVIGVGFGEDGDWCAKYGCDYENDVFAMHRFYWGDCTCHAHDGVPDDQVPPPHKPDCLLNRPNFLYKPTGFALDWYKYIGRDMEVTHEDPLPGDFMEKIFASHPKGMTLDQAISETARQEEQTAESFRKMFSALNIQTL